MRVDIRVAFNFFWYESQLDLLADNRQKNSLNCNKRKLMGLRDGSEGKDAYNQA